MEEVDGNEFTERVEQIYEKIVYWKRNLFLLPSGKTGRIFTDETVRLLNSWTERSALDNIPFKVVTVLGIETKLVSNGNKMCYILKVSKFHMEKGKVSS